MTATHMRREIEEIPQAVERLLKSVGDDVARTAEAFARADPLVIATVARGSSDHAAHFLKYAYELTLGLPGASLGPSLASVYGLVPRLERAVVMAISQSGRSPDIVSMTAAARRGGACAIAFVNTLPSPLAEVCDFAVEISAGPERSVAATKSFVCSIAAGLALLAELEASGSLRAALAEFPGRLREALACDWSQLVEPLLHANSLYVLGRGPSLAIAGEVALKFKETCGVHAEAYSAAEVMHGPVELVAPGFPVIGLAGRDAAEASVAEIADRLAQQGAIVHATTSLCRRAASLPVQQAGHPLLDALIQVVPAYLFLEMLSRRRGRDPDAPKRLRKVTETV
jgi:glucosamine--fructose-6-phosphate aminotransferase (isomerizing)